MGKKILVIGDESCFVEKFFNEVYIGAAHKMIVYGARDSVFVCAYYNRQIPGKYEFIPEYSFYVTKGADSRSLFWNKGYFDEDQKKKIIEEYKSLDEAKDSEYYSFFRKLKKEIDTGIADKKSCKRETKILPGISYFLNDNVDIGDYEWGCKETNEYVQLLIDLRKHEWKLSTSKVPTETMKEHFKNFDELDKEIFHVKKYLNVDAENLPETSPYFYLVNWAKEDLGIKKGIDTGLFTEDEIDFLTCKEGRSENIFTRDGKVTLKENGKIRSVQTYPLEKVEKFFKSMADFLSRGISEQYIMPDKFDDVAIFHLKDGREIKYDKNLKRKETYFSDLFSELYL